MRFYQLLLACVISTSLMALAPHSMKYVPRGNLNPAGHYDFELDYTNYSLDSTMSSQGSYHFSYAFSDLVTYGFSGDGTGLAHHLSAVLYKTPSHMGKINHYFTGGVHNIGYESLANREIFYSDLFLQYTLDIVGHRTEYHFGVVRDATDITSYIPIFGTLHEFDYIDVGLETSGKSVGIIFQYRPVEDVSYVLRISQSLLDEDSEDYTTTPSQVFTTGLKLHGNVFDIFRKTMVSKDDMQQELKMVNTRLSVLEAKEKALSDMSTLDMFESLEQALVNRNVIEDEFDTQTKNLVKGALSHMQKGLEYYYQKKYKAALEEYKIVISLLPNTYIGHLRIGSIYYKLDDPINAKKHWRKALQLNPSNEKLRRYINGLIEGETSTEGKSSEDDMSLPDDLLESVIQDDETPLLDQRDGTSEPVPLDYQEFERGLFELEDYDNEE